MNLGGCILFAVLLAPLLNFWQRVPFYITYFCPVSSWKTRINLNSHMPIITSHTYLLYFDFLKRHTRICDYLHALVIHHCSG
ncbi:hypothetical protein ASPWEDRAFT_717949 [Aspergillus wentii DTO 134E9]|uniref:Secreted protein n=1 Tax=Aspergillus wentii DTO 134E9 TaxID=1073089 RepID=A0A1L9R6Q1_ASPWE|nr:uncharacterized protein ASPWEDRAFT_717949 [Aspergillus wentii DTO 134E9]OJJ30563.1 hypothetical protein ASPWEDRAFT_717949 [Aspergillus wentii DTO 134E9]